jgi:hypothetical protein
MRIIIAAMGLVLLAILFRTTWHVGPNIEFITTATLLASVYLGPCWAIVVPMASIVISDMFIGNTSIYLFTWSAYVVMGFSTVVFRASRLKACSLTRKWSVLCVSGIGAGVWFYLWTNFGVWYLDSWSMYDDTMGGLLRSYVMGLPFLRYTMIGTVGFMLCSGVLIESIVILEKPRLYLGGVIRACLKSHTPAIIGSFHRSSSSFITHVASATIVFHSLRTKKNLSKLSRRRLFKQAPRRICKEWVILLQ